jgi:anti-sigma B factor antagonist
MHFVETKFNKVIVLTIKGNLVQKDETDKLQKRILDILGNDKKFIVVDLKQVSMITSLGIGGLIRALRTVREKDGDLRLSAVNASVRKVFTITKLEEVIKIFDTSDEAVKSFD